MSSSEVELEIDELATFLFKKNKHNKIIELELNGIQDTRDLFCFCIDLLCKGLVICCCGDDKTSIDVDAISFDQFTEVMKKMKLAGIKANLSVDENSMSQTAAIDMGEKYKNKQICPLSEYTFSIISPKHIYRVVFELERPI